MTSEQLRVLHQASAGVERPRREYNLDAPLASAAMAYCATLADVVMEQQQQIDRLTKLVEQLGKRGDI